METESKFTESSFNQVRFSSGLTIPSSSSSQRSLKDHHEKVEVEVEVKSSEQQSDSLKTFCPHVLCFYRETKEIKLSLGSFKRNYNPTVIAIIEHAKVSHPTVQGVLKYLVEENSAEENVNSNEYNELLRKVSEANDGRMFFKGKHSKSGADFLVYVKGRNQTRGKRHSHFLALHLLLDLKVLELGNPVSFMDADTATNPTTADKARKLITQNNVDAVACSLITLNAKMGTSIGKFVFSNELQTLGERLGTSAFGFTCILSGPFTTFNSAILMKYEELYLVSYENMSLFQLNSAMNEDMWLTQMMLADNRKLLTIADEVGWNLPETYEELVAQRRRWTNGSIANSFFFFKHSKFSESKLRTLVIWYIMACYNLIRYVPVALVIVMGLFLLEGRFELYEDHPYLTSFPFIFFGVMKIFSTLFWFRKKPQGRETLFFYFFHLYGVIHSFQAGISIYLTLHYFGIWPTLPLLQFFPLIVVITYSKFDSSRLFLSLTSVYFTVYYGHGFQSFLQDYSFANWSDVTWGTRETKDDRKIYKEGRIPGILQVKGYRFILQHILFLLVVYMVFSSIIWAAYSYTFQTLLFFGVTLLPYFLLVFLGNISKLFYTYHKITAYLIGPVWDYYEDEDCFQKLL